MCSILLFLSFGVCFVSENFLDIVVVLLLVPTVSCVLAFCVYCWFRCFHLFMFFGLALFCLCSLSLIWLLFKNTNEKQRTRRKNYEQEELQRTQPQKTSHNTKTRTNTYEQRTHSINQIRIQDN